MTREKLRAIETRRDSLRVEVEKLTNILTKARPYFQRIENLEHLIKYLECAEQACIIHNRIEYQLPILSDECRKALISMINIAIAELKKEAEDLE